MCLRKYTQLVKVIALKKCDLLREKGPTAVKHRFKLHLTAFSLAAFLQHLYFCQLTAVERLSLEERKKEEKNAVNLILLI